MPLPTAFSNNTNPTGPQLDGNFAAVGVLAVIPCSVSGTNALTLTPLANTPTIAAYSNYLRVSGVFGIASNAAMTARIGALAILPVYVDTPAGPVATSGGEGILDCAFTLSYDSALNSGGGGWHLYTTPLSAMGGTIGGNLTVEGIFSGATVNGTTGSISTLTVADLFSPLASIGTLTAASLINALGSIGTLHAGNILAGSVSATLSRIVSTQATLAFSVVAANAAQDQPASLAAVKLGDCIAVGVTAVPTGAGFSAYVPAAGTINLRCLNASTVTLGAFTVIARLTGLGGTP